MPVSPTFWGNLIRDLRQKQGLSQRELAIRARVNRSTLRSIEDGRTPGDMKIMEQLLSYLGYELEAMASEGKDERLRRMSKDETDPQRRSRLAANRILIAFSPLQDGV